MEEIRKTQKKYCSRAMFAAIFGGLFLILAGQVSIGKGLILGTIFSAINFVLMGETLPVRLLQNKKNKAVMFSLRSIAIRYLILALPLLLAIKIEQFNLISVICGIFMVQLMIFGDQLIKTISELRQKRV